MELSTFNERTSNRNPRMGHKENSTMGYQKEKDPVTTGIIMYIQTAVCNYQHKLP